VTTPVDECARTNRWNQSWMKERQVRMNAALLAVRPVTHIVTAGQLTKKPKPTRSWMPGWQPTNSDEYIHGWMICWPEYRWTREDIYWWNVVWMNSGDENLHSLQYSGDKSDRTIPWQRKPPCGWIKARVMNFVRDGWTGDTRMDECVDVAWINECRVGDGCYFSCSTVVT